MTTTQATPLPPSHQTPHASLHRFSPSGSSRIYHSSSISPVISNSPPPDNFNPPSASTSAAAKTVNVNTVSEWSTNPFSFSTDNQNDPLIHHDHDPDPDHDHDSHHQRHQQSLSNSASKTTSSSSGSMRKPHPHSTASSPYDIRTDIRINPINHGYFSAAKSGLTPTTNPASVSGYGSGITSSDLNSLLDSQPTSSLGLDMEGGKRNASSEPKDKAQDKDKEGRTIKSDHPNTMKSHPPPDPRYPYANLLQPIPLDIHSQPQPPAQSSSSLAGGPASASTSLYHQPSSATSSTPTSAYFPNAGLLDIPLPDQAAQSSSMSNNSNLNSSSDSYTNPTKADILRRHSISRSYWDDPSPEQESLLASAPNSAKNSPSSGNQGGEVPKTSGRSGQKRRQKYTRTRTGCLCCRARRIKCDEGRPTCKRCIIAKKECQYPDPGEGEAKRPSGKGKHGSRGDSDASESEEEDRPAAKRRRSDAGKGKTPPDQVPGIPYSSPDDGNGTGSAALGEVAWDASFVNPATTINGSSNSNLDYDSGLAIGTGLASSGEQYLAGQIGKQEWATSEGGGAPMLTTPNFLLPWFPTAEERSLILHYCANAASLMMAIPSGLNPMLAINLPLALDSPRGLNPSADALRVALLGTGAIHQAFLLARSGVANHQTAAMFQYASTLRDTGKEMVRRAVRDGNGAMTDAALGASTALGTIDIFFGGSGWMDNFNLAKEMVALRGGPAEMLKNSEPRKLTDGVTVSPARLMLEILAIYETFSCLTTGQEPDLFSDRWESWWLEASRSTYEEHSVEKQFGMSRIMVLLFARVTRLLARVSRSKLLITESPPTNLSLTDPSTTPFGSSDSLLSSLARGLTAEKDLDPLVIEARQLNRDVDAWIDSLQLSTLEHERVQVGNRAYAYAMKILLLTMVFKYPREDLRVQNAAQQVLQHCSWSTAALGMSIDLTWPAIIAGSCVNGASRQWVSTLLEGFKSQCCFDIETANRIILEVWRRADAGERRADWKNVCDDLGLQVLLC